MTITLDTHDPRSLKALAIAAEAGHDVSYRGEICRAAIALGLPDTTAEDMQTAGRG